MTRQLLIYERAVPITQKRHGDWAVVTAKEYSFARHVNSVPLVAAEFSSAAAEYPIVFTGSEEAIMPVVILGVREGMNLYLSETGEWQAKYIPAFVRRYPFVFSSADEGATFTLCIDEEFAGCNQEGRGERLFDSEGERTQYLQSVLGFLSEYQAQYQLTQAFCKKLNEQDLLEPMQAQFTWGTGEQISLTGFMAVSRERLKRLPGDKLSELARTNELELMYTHLQSMTNFSPIVERAASKEKASRGEKGPAEAPAMEPAEAPAKEPAAKDATERKSKGNGKGKRSG